LSVLSFERSALNGFWIFASFEKKPSEMAAQSRRNLLKNNGKSRFCNGADPGAAEKAAFREQAYGFQRVTGRSVRWLGIPVQAGNLPFTAWRLG
jgi:hypothetical protein